MIAQLLKNGLLYHTTTLTDLEEDRLAQKVFELGRTESANFEADSGESNPMGACGWCRRRPTERTEVWCRGFLLRRPTLSMRTVEALSLDRVKHTTERAVAPHIKTLEQVLERHDLWKPARRIWNADQTGMKLGQRGHMKVIASRGVEKVHSKAPSDM